MRDETREYLDGERSRAELSPAAAEEAEAWERLLAAMRADVPGPAPVWLEGSVMSHVRSAAARKPSAARRAGAWLLRPSLSLSPLTAGLAAAALLALLLVPWREEALVPEPAVAVGGEGAGVPGSGADPVVYVQFVLEAPSARSVAVAGDFNEWDARHALEDSDGDGVWTGRVPIRPGVHQYMFVIDGTEWVTDPGADRWTDDGFGNRNAVLAVAPAA
jgi:hypothetical protein